MPYRPSPDSTGETLPFRTALGRLALGRRLGWEDTADAFGTILDGGCQPEEVAAFLTACQMVGIDAVMLGGAVAAIARRQTSFSLSDHLRPVVDTCGTGGDGANSVNVSTAAAIVVAACGVRVAKHGNRSATGNSGSADVLAALGVRFDAEPETCRRCLEDLGITFLFAPRFHPSLGRVAPVRKLLPFRTVFNLIGPLVNPARPDAQLLGTPDRARAILLSSYLRYDPGNPGVFPPEPPDLRSEIERLDEALKVPGGNRARERSTFRAFVVAGEDGLDEVTLESPTRVFSVERGRRREGVWSPEDFGLPRSPHAALSVSGPEQSAAKIRAMLAGEPGPVRDVVLANAAAALRLVDRAGTLAEGVAIAAEAIDRGDAARLLRGWAALSHRAD